MSNQEIIKELTSMKIAYNESINISSMRVFEAMDLARKDEAVEFQIWVRKNYSISKGMYQHRGDFYKNSKLINESELYTIFKQLN